MILMRYSIIFLWKIKCLIIKNLIKNYEISKYICLQICHKIATKILINYFFSSLLQQELIHLKM